MFAGLEGGSCVLQITLNRRYDRVRAAEQAPRSPFRFLDRLHCLAEIAERGGVVSVERLRIKRPHPEHGVITISKNASCDG